MKLYKIDFTNTIGDYVVTVPTDSQFLLGISNGDSDAEVELLDGATEITPEDDKIGAYTVFAFETDGTPFKKHLKAVITKTDSESESEEVIYTQNIDILIKCEKMSIAYRDIDTTLVADEVVEMIEESGAFQTTLKPLTLETPSSNLSLDIDDTNFMDVERTVYEIGTTDSLVTPVGLTASIDLADFPVESGESQLWKLNLKINCEGAMVSNPATYFSVVFTDENNTSTIDTDDVYVNYISGPTSLSTVIGDMSGESILVELVFGVDGGFANIKGASYIPAPVTPGE